MARQAERETGKKKTEKSEPRNTHRLTANLDLEALIIHHGPRADFAGTRGRHVRRTQRHGDGGFGLEAVRVPREVLYVRVGHLVATRHVPIEIIGTEIEAPLAKNLKKRKKLVHNGGE